MSRGSSGAGIRNFEEISEVGLMSRWSCYESDSQPVFPDCQGEYRDVFLAEPRWAHKSSSFSCFLTEDIANAAYRRHKTSLMKQLERTLLWVFSCFINFQERQSLVAPRLTVLMH